MCFYLLYIFSAQGAHSWFGFITLNRGCIYSGSIIRYQVYIIWCIGTGFCRCRFLLQVYIVHIYLKYIEYMFIPVLVVYRVFIYLMAIFSLYSEYIYYICIYLDILLQWTDAASRLWLEVVPI